MKHIILFAVILFASCRSPSRTEQALMLAGNNRAELERVLAHYLQSPDDSLKYRAAVFLIENMPGKFYYDGATVREKHRFMDSVFRIEAKEYDYIRLDSAFGAGRRYGDGDRQRFLDVEHLSADFLIDNIEQAFEAWQKPWARDVPFDMFCEYVLPYRTGNEAPQKWRRLYTERFEKALTAGDGAAAFDNPVDAATAVADVLLAYKMHVRSLSFIPASVEPQTLLDLKFGACMNYASLTVFAMRSVGIPAAVEIAPQWGRSCSGHAFNVVFDADGRYYDFLGGEEHPQEEHLSFFRTGFSKIYRQTYSMQPNSLAAICGDEDIPDVFKGGRLLDVTGNYAFFRPQTVSVRLPEKRPACGFAYLCVFNPDRWYPVDWSVIKGDSATFVNVGPDVVYQAGLYRDGKIYPFGHPFRVDSPGTVHPFTPSGKYTAPVLERTCPVAIKPADSIRNVGDGGIYRDNLYELMYNDGGYWVSAGSRIAEADGVINFQSVPSGCLYRLRNRSRRSEERPFTVENGRQTWW